MNKKRKKVDEVKNIKEVCDMPLRKYMTSKRRNVTITKRLNIKRLQIVWNYSGISSKRNWYRNSMPYVG